MGWKECISSSFAIVLVIYIHLVEMWHGCWWKLDFREDGIGELKNGLGDGFDYILGSDVVFKDGLVDPLLRCILDLANTRTTVEWYIILNNIKTDCMSRYY